METAGHLICRFLFDSLTAQTTKHFKPSCIKKSDEEMQTLRARLRESRDAKRKCSGIPMQNLQKISAVAL